MHMSNITFEVTRLSIFVFKKSSGKSIFTIIFVVESLNGFGWNNVRPVSQTVAQQYFTIGPMYLWVNIETSLGECHALADVLGKVYS